MINAEEAKKMSNEYWENEERILDEEITEWLNDYVNREITEKAKKGGTMISFRLPDRFYNSAPNLEKKLNSYGYETFLNPLDILEVSWK